MLGNNTKKCTLYRVFIFLNTYHRLNVITIMLLLCPKDTITKTIAFLLLLHSEWAYMYILSIATNVILSTFLFIN